MYLVGETCGLVSQHFECFRLRLPIAYVERSCTFSNTTPVYSWRWEPENIEVLYGVSDSFEAKAENYFLNMHQPI
jgi:hypothetical protein